jgi:hypothetical protein
MKSVVQLYLLVGFAVFFVSSSDAQTNWTKYPGAFDGAIMSSSFDSEATECYDPMVLLDGATYKMWYTRKVSGTEKFAYATSTDGIAWTLVDTAVFIAANKSTTRFDYKKVGQGGVIRDGDTLKMWYWGDGPNGGNIGLAWSLDGRGWQRVDGSNADLSVYNCTSDGSGSYAICTPSVVKVGSTYHMWYTRIPSWKIAYATSPDGLNWTNVPGTGTLGAVVDVGTAGSFDESLLGFPTVLKTATGFEMWYYARNNLQQSGIGYATSTDGINWTKYTGSASNGSLLDLAATCSVIKEETIYKMWYIYYNTMFYYATAPTTTGVEDNTMQPATCTLHQNYPNPFNPSTTISYQLAKAGYVKLTVFDLLGREVATLVNNIQSAGMHSATWNAKNSASGIYYYQLSSGINIQTRKLVLTK